MLTYAEAVDQLYSLGLELAPTAPRRKFELDHMRLLAASLGDPQSTYPSILIAGTNGKGSTAATLSSILAATGARTALYTSPHLYHVNERIQVNGTPIPDADFARLYTRVAEAAKDLVADQKLPHLPSFFEVLTAIAFTFFAEQKVDIAVLEVGLGGRLDATNIVDPLISVLTDIALDHQDYLGDTITLITREKAGILRPHGTLVTLPQHPEANQAIGEAAAGLDLHAINAADYIPTPEAIHHEKASATPLPRNHYTVAFNGLPLVVDSPLPGQHQQRNIALALAVVNTLAISNKFSYKIEIPLIEAGIRNTHWPGRLEFIPPNLLLDVAHNPAGAWTLRAAITRLPDDQPRTLIFSCLRDKDLDEMTRILFPLFDKTSGDPARAHDHIVLAPIPNNPRAAAVEDLLAAAHRLDIPAHAAPHLEAALAQARAITPEGGIILATGSVYLVGELRHLAVMA
ncbi:dihydrofolate synthase / folylpolyglutamate synthase [Granulicella pectinivorans]|uniref:Dihydrofolate synthase/folylpolyglutamate synthase n=1 Tax=Granulicella pectinivorans TaxID=474950 RepID=A0A1I6LG33_9BACT|nr:folylpolyglutamate synthase/dihydrofolate synthase family protein [Granulicella pectinivorans]SFS02394.1 dihydrofolate synthase / folylpolyglutamate synthase [Granulicella pectinivorans]